MRRAEASELEPNPVISGLIIFVPSSILVQQSMLLDALYTELIIT
jgi:hypothetical protein